MDRMTINVFLYFSCTNWLILSKDHTCFSTYQFQSVYLWMIFKRQMCDWNRKSYTSVLSLGILTLAPTISYILLASYSAYFSISFLIFEIVIIILISCCINQLGWTFTEGILWARNSSRHWDVMAKRTNPWPCAGVEAVVLSCQ